MFNTARFNMIEAQIRTNDVTDVRIHAAFGAVERERFVPPAKKALAYADVPVEIAPGRYLLDPRSFAKALQMAEILRPDLRAKAEDGEKSNGVPAPEPFVSPELTT